MRWAAVCLGVLLLAGSIASAQTQVKLTSGDVVAPGGLEPIGKSIAFDGDTVVVGSYVDADQFGSVYVYGSRTAVSSRARAGQIRWGRLAAIVSPDARRGERFGYSVAVAGEMIIVGAPGSGDSDTSGSVYVFQRNPGRLATWSPAARLTSPNPGGDDLFGSSVAGNGTTLVIGAPGDSQIGLGAGAAYVFEREETGDWAPAAALVGSDAEVGSRFGYAVAIDGDDIVVGAMGHNSAGFNSGAAYVFSRNEGGEGRWAQSAKLVAGDLTQGANFGIAVAISDSTIVVGASGDSRLGQNAGGAYVFDRLLDSPNLWTETTKLVPDDSAAGDLFGFRGAVAINGNLIAIGALGTDDPSTDSGSVYIFQRNLSSPGQWNLIKTLAARDPVEFGRYGSAVALGDVNVAVAAATDAQAGKDTGLAYVALPLIPVDVLVKPGKLSIKSAGKTTDIAVLSTGVFDAPTEVDPSTVQVEGASPLGPPQIKDLDKDGLDDLVFRFQVMDLGLECGQESVTLTGMTLGGEPIMGTGAIEVKGCGSDDGGGASELTITKGSLTVPPDFIAGMTAVYKVTVENIGGKAAKNATVSDTLDPRLSFNAGLSSGACSASGQTVTCAIGDLEAGDMIMFNIGVNIASSATGSISNFAMVSARGGPSNNVTSNSVTIPVIVESDLAIDKQVTSADFKAGQQATYTLTVTNNGPSDAVNVSVSDAIPAPLSIDSVTSSQGGCAALPCNLGTIADGANATVTIVVSIPSSATGLVTNTATVSNSPDTDPNAGNDSDDDMTNINVMADLSIIKTANPTTMTAGSAGQVTYTLQVTNNGPADATNVTVEDVLPAGVTLVSATGPMGACPGAGTGGDPIVCDLGTVIDQATPSVTIIVTVDADTAAGTITNTGEVKSADDTMTGNNTNTADVTVEVEVDLSITKTDGITTVIAGNQLTYTIVVSNGGPSDAVGATVTDTFPAELTVNAWTCTPAGAGSSCSNGTGDLSDSVNIGPGGSVTFSVTATVDPGATGTLSNTASVTKPVGSTDASNLDDTATDNDTVITQAADLSITKTAQNVVAGDQVTYTITASNPGPSDAVNATVTDTFPGSLSNVSWTCVAGATSSCAAGNNGNINEMVTIAAGESVVFTATGNLASDAMGDLVNTAMLAAPGGFTDSNLVNNSATDTTTIAKEANLNITKTDNPNDPVVAGGGAGNLHLHHYGDQHRPVRRIRRSGHRHPPHRCVPPHASLPF